MGNAPACPVCPALPSPTPARPPSLPARPPAGLVEVPLLVRFATSQAKGPGLPPQRLTLVARGRELPVFAEREELDFA